MRLTLLVLTYLGCQGATKPAAETGPDVPASTDSSGGATPTGTSTTATGTTPTGTTPTGTIDPFADCLDRLVPALTWDEGTDEVPLDGALELGQTHVTAPDDPRLAPPALAERETLLLFTPERALPADTVLQVAAFDDGVPLGVLAATPPTQPVPILEQRLTSSPLEPYSTESWSAHLPWSWLSDGVELRIGYLDGDTLHLHEHTLRGLGAPHRFTLSRAHVVLFGEDDFEATTRPAEQLAPDFFASSPVAELRWVDHTPWRLDEIVVPTEDGPRWASSEAERLAVTSEPNRWSILKNQLALRLSTANTGRGLALTAPPEGDSSPYSFGTSVALGWVNDGSRYIDINDAGLAAGWTGWTATWLEECENVFIHEVGHSYTLAHFTDGVADSWGIGDEYPQDGTHVEEHPWGYDTTRRQLRTWYRVDSGGPVTDGVGLIGKNDPMNGGEPANAVTCFPQYIPYQARVAQSWLQGTPTLAELDGEVGAWLWDAESSSYAPEPVSSAYQEPLAVDVPVVTLIGTLGDTDAVCQTYPPLYASSGNTFALPDPTDPDLHSDFTGARWFLKIEHATGPDAYALIQEGLVADPELRLYALNLPLDDVPTAVELYRAERGWPNIDLSDAERIHRRELEAPDTLPEVVTVGRGALGADTLTLSQRCTAGFDCDVRAVSASWRESAQQLHFTEAPATACGAEGEVTELRVPIIDDAGASATLVVHGQRVLSAGSEELAFALTDATPWRAAPDLTQSLRLWVPYAENASLPAGHYSVDGPFAVALQRDGVADGEVPLVVDLTIRTTEAIDISEPYLHDEGVYLADSSAYYVTDDPSIGPTNAVWWDDGVPGGTLLYVPMVDDDTGEALTVTLEAFKVACDDYWDLNTGQASDWGCTHVPYLSVAAEGNEALESGHTYRSPGSTPLVLHGMRWHEPAAWTLQRTFAFALTYTAP